MKIGNLFIQKTTVLLLKKDQIKIKSREKKIFNNLHKYLPKNKLNSFRMRLYEILNSKKWFLKNVAFKFLRIG